MSRGKAKATLRLIDTVESGVSKRADPLTPTYRNGVKCYGFDEETSDD